MSAVCVLTPIVIASWPVLTPLVVSVASALGFTAARKTRKTKKDTRTSLEMELENSSVVTDELALAEDIVLQRDDVVVTFYKDPRGKCGIRVEGKNRSNEELDTIGKELSQKVIQQYVYNRLVTELKSSGFALAEEEVDENQTIRLKVRRWQ